MRIENKEQTQEPNYQFWLARSTWRPAEAACLLMGKDPNLYIKESNYFNQKIDDPEIKALFDIINTWYEGNNWLCFTPPPFFFINKALQNYIDIPLMLLEKVKNRYSKYSKNELQLFADKYPEIEIKIQELGTTESEQHRKINNVNSLKNGILIQDQDKEIILKEGRHKQASIAGSSNKRNKDIPKIQEKVFELYEENEGKYKSTRDASKKINQQLFDENFYINHQLHPLAPTNSQRTIYEWLLKYIKNQFAPSI